MVCRSSAVSYEALCPPPRPPGRRFEPDYPRLLLGILSLSLVLVLAVINLWEPTGGAGPYQGSSRPS